MKTGNRTIILLFICVLTLIFSATCPAATTYYFDGDQDGYGDTNTTITQDAIPSFLWKTTPGDCDDNDDTINPDATEVGGDSVDQDCDGFNDPIYYLDSDNDTYGDENTSQEAATQPTGYVLDKSDCNDADATINPAATDTPGDTIDQNCDGADDTAWYKDADLDGFGDSTATQDAGAKPVGYVADNTDCNDADPTIYPGATEIAGDSIDQDCNGFDASSTFSGIITSDVDGGLAPVVITFYTLISEGSAPFTYSYDFGDGTVKSGATKTESHTYMTTGSYTAEVTITDAAGASYKRQKDVIISDTAQVNTYQDNLQDDADQAKKAADGDEMTGILNDAENIVDKTLKSITNADQNTKLQIQQSVQTKVEDLVGNTDTNLANLIQNGKVTTGDFTDITEGLSGVISNMVKNELPISEGTLDSAESISQKLFAQTLEDVLKNQNVDQTQIDNMKTDSSTASTYFQSNTHLLDDVLGSSGIPVNTSKDFDAGDIDTVAADQGLSDEKSGQLYNAIETTLNVQLKVASTTSVKAKTIAEFAAEIYDTYFGKTLKTHTVEDITGNLLLEFTDGTFVSFLITNAYIKQDYMPKGLFDLPNGNKLGITDSYAMEFVSYPVFASQFMANVIGLGLGPKLTNDGGLSIDLGSSTNISLKMGWDYADTDTFNALTTAFSVVGGGDPSAEAYSLLVTYDGGKSQLMPPSIYALDSLTTWLDANLAGQYSIDVNTGVLTLGTLKLKPDYLIVDLTSIDYTGIVAAGGFQFDKLAFELIDVNGDGLPDLKYYSDSPMGYQVLYVLP